MTLDPTLPMKTQIKNNPRLMDVFAQIAAERRRQKELLRDGRILFNLDSPVVDNDRKLRIVVEEIGEIANAIDRLESLKRGTASYAAGRAHLEEEVVQAAACLCAWLETAEVTP